MVVWCCGGVDSSEVVVTADARIAIGRDSIISYASHFLVLGNENKLNTVMYTRRGVII